MNPRSRRLQSDFSKVNNLLIKSGGTLKLMRKLGQPPTTYVIEYHCPSLVKDNMGRVTIQHRHEVEINLGSNYPLQKPTAKILTSIFNPHVYLNNSICLGVLWSPAETLDTLILRIGALLQLDPKVLDPNSPANSEANQWVKLNRSKIPLGDISFISNSDNPPKKIIWG